MQKTANLYARTGINPGGDFAGIRSLINPIVEVYKKENNLQTANWFEYGAKIEKHPFAEKIYSLFMGVEDDVLNTFFRNAVVMNNCFFNTGSVSKLNRLAYKPDAVCGQITRRFIDEVIYPKRILTLGNIPFCNFKINRKKLSAKISGRSENRIEIIFLYITYQIHPE